MEDAYIMRLHKQASVRPFVSPGAWALYAVYCTIIAAGIGKMKMLKLGFDPRKYFNDQHWSALLPGVLPREDIQLVGRDSEHGVQWVSSARCSRVGPLAVSRVWKTPWKPLWQPVWMSRRWISRPWISGWIVS
jgi:hypothetical protein